MNLQYRNTSWHRNSTLLIHSELNPPVTDILWMLLTKQVMPTFDVLSCQPEQLVKLNSRITSALRWRQNDHDGVSNHQSHGCLLNRLFRRRSKKTSKLRVTGLCVGNSPGTGEFPAQRASYAENVSIWWRHHGFRTPWRTRKLMGCHGLLRAQWLYRRCCFS